jgi:hypothetical protein
MDSDPPAKTMFVRYVNPDAESTSSEHMSSSVRLSLVLKKLFVVRLGRFVSFALKKKDILVSRMDWSKSGSAVLRDSLSTIVNADSVP